MKDNRFYGILAAVLVVFAGIRIVFLLDLFDTAILKILLLDSDWYFFWAKNLAQNLGHPQGAFWLGPGYPLAVSWLFKAAGSISVTLIPVAQVMISGATVVFLALTVRRLLGETTALITAGIAALYAPWIYYDGMILSASWILFLNSALLYLLLARTDLFDDLQRGWISQLFVWGLAGLVCGLSALARPSILIFALLLMIAMIFRPRLPGRFVKIAVFASLILMVHLPVLSRNWEVDGSAAFVTSSGGINFYIGNRDGASGRYDDAPWLESSDAFREAEGYRTEAEARTGKSLTLNQASGYWAKTALRDILEYKLDWLKLMGKKVWLLSRREELANNFSFCATQSFIPWLSLTPMRWGLLLPLAMAGLVLIWPQRKKFWVCALYGAGYVTTNLIFFVSSEYRFPLILFLLPLAAYFLVEIRKLYVAQAWSRIALPVIVFCMFLIIANWPSPEMSKITCAAVDYHNLGSVTAKRGEHTDAAAFYSQALMIDDSYKKTRIGLADALWTLGRFEEARQEYQRAGIDSPDKFSGNPADSLTSK
jgi:tetratricopeptide (TPR) repeat protein